MAQIKNIIIHCSDSPFGNVNDIRQWHKEKGWRDIGYHFVILNGLLDPDFYLPALNGSIECGRPLDGDKWIVGNEVGAHALGYNKNSIGICLIGETAFTPDQHFSLLTLIKDLIAHFAECKIKVLGHCETEKGRGKTCPNIDMDKFRSFLVS